MAKQEQVDLVKRWMAWQFSRFVRGSKVDENIRAFLNGPPNAKIPINFTFVLTDDLQRRLEAGDTAEFAEFPVPGLDKSV